MKDSAAHVRTNITDLKEIHRKERDKELAKDTAYNRKTRKRRKKPNQKKTTTPSEDTHKLTKER